MDISGTITTRVDASNQHFVTEPTSQPEIIQIMNILPDRTEFTNPQDGRVYSVEGISPTISTMQGGNKQPKIIESIGCAMRGRNPENPPERGRSNGKYKQRIEMGNNISNTITSVQKDALVAEPTILQRPNGFNKGGEHEISPTMTGSAFQENNVVIEPDWQTVVGSKQANSFLGDVNGEEPCITSACGAGGGMNPMVTDASLKEANTEEFREQVRGHKNIQYRIRKLTPRECFRLMGVSETNIDKIQNSGVSQSQQYKMAGNSIVVDVLEHIFRKMFVDTEQESQQLSLF